MGADDLAFVAKRGLRQRVHRIKFADIVQAEWKRGLLMNRLVLRTARGEQTFYVFKDVEIPRVEAVAAVSDDPLVAIEPH